MKLTINGALDLSKSINSQTIFNKRSLESFNKLDRDLKDESKDRLRLPPSPRSKSSKSTGKTRNSIFVAKLGNTNRLRMSQGIKLASSSKTAPFIHGKPIFRSFKPIKKTKPFFPPYKKGSSLAKWAARGTPKLNAFLVARAISQRGLKMKPFIGGTVFENQDKIKKELDDMMENIARDIARSVK
jgi:hypothetical protein